MNTDFPIPITTESDLDHYENYLSSEFSSIPKTENKLSKRLNAYIGKPLKVDYAIGNKPEARIGILLSIGDDFLLIKPPYRCEIILPLSSVKSITVLQNNTKLPHF